MLLCIYSLFSPKALIRLSLQSVWRVRADYGILDLYWNQLKLNRHIKGEEEKMFLCSSLFQAQSFPMPYIKDKCWNCCPFSRNLMRKFRNFSEFVPSKNIFCLFVVEDFTVQDCANRHELCKRNLPLGFFFSPGRLELPLSIKPRSGPLPVVQRATSMWSPSTQTLWVFLPSFLFLLTSCTWKCCTLHSVRKNRTQGSTQVFLVSNLMHGIDGYNQRALSCSYNMFWKQRTIF